MTRDEVARQAQETGLALTSAWDEAAEIIRLAEVMPARTSADFRQLIMHAHGTGLIQARISGTVAAKLVGGLVGLVEVPWRAFTQARLDTIYVLARVYEPDLPVSWQVRRDGADGPELIWDLPSEAAGLEKIADLWRASGGAERLVEVRPTAPQPRKTATRFECVRPPIFPR